MNMQIVGRADKEMLFRDKKVPRTHTTVWTNLDIVSSERSQTKKAELL